MNDSNDFERFVADQFARERGGPAPSDETIHDLLTKASHARQRPRWLAILKEPPMRHASRVVVGSPTARVSAFVAVTLLLALSATGAIVAGQSPSPAPPDKEPAPQPPAEFTGVWCIGPEVAPDRNGTITTIELGDDGLTLTRNQGGAWRNAVSMSDPRLQGDAYQTYETDTYDPPSIEVISSTLSIVNEEGAWVSRHYSSRGTPAGSTDTGNVFIGQGAYEGLIAFMSTGAPVLRPEGITAEYVGCEELQGIIIDDAVAEPFLP
jgi:hypothetical protein